MPKDDEWIVTTVGEPDPACVVSLLIDGESYESRALAEILKGSARNPDPAERTEDTGATEEPDDSG